MSRESVQQRELESTVGQLAQAVDVDAEHDPTVSRRASNAALRREAVQMKADGAGKQPALEAAERGVQSPSTALPHADRIQRAFGAHDISHIQAHVGDGSAAAMGAEAYATGNHVVFDKEPDLHTAAHEAAHVVQQAQGVNLYGGVGKAGDSYERNADEVADRVVQGKSAEDLLGTPTSASGQGGVVQAKPGPSQAYADQGVIHAIQTHVKLTAARMHAGAAKIRELLKSPTGGPAGNAPMLMGIQQQVDLVTGDLDSLQGEIMRVPSVVRGTLGPEFGTLVTAFHMSWAPALNKVYGYTHDVDGNRKPFAEGLDFSVTTSREKMRWMFRAAGVEEQDITAAPANHADLFQSAEEQDEDLKAAELEALKAGMWSVETAVDLIKADLHSSVSDQSKQARDLTVSIEQLVAVLEPIDPSHIGKISKLPIVIKQVEALQAEVMQMKDADEDKGKSLAPTIGYNTQLSRNLFRIKTKLGEISSYQKQSAKQGKRH